MALKDALLAEYDHEMAATRKLLERIPEDKLAWTPHARSRSLGALATHFGNILAQSDLIFSATSFDLSSAPLQADTRGSLAEILTHFDVAVAKVRAAMDRTDGEYLAMWTLKRDGHEVFSMPRISMFRTFVLSHLIHHRGQLSVYLRLNDIPVPAIYGPSADEG